jgi:hypothetical protein
MFRISWKEETGKSEEGYGWARAAPLGPLSDVDLNTLVVISGVLASYT